MLKFFVKALGVIAGLAISGAACALGMGNINVSTALGEPLQAQISLLSVSKADKGNLTARLAAPDVFKGAGVEYPSALPNLKFQIESNASGDAYIKVTSEQPVNDPFVDVLIELSWPSGKLLREYTFLLDPPDFKAVQPKAAVVRPVKSMAAEPAMASPEPVQTESMGGMNSGHTIIVPASDTNDAMQSASSGRNVASGTITVKRGDSLSKIASENKPADVSLERMLVALYRANSDSFDGNNMNRLKTGKILRLPEAAELEQVEQKEAVKEVHAQVADWNDYRQKLAAASGTAPEQAPKQEVSGKVNTMVADKAPVAKEAAKDVVKLSKGEAPGDKAAPGAPAKQAQDKMHAQQEEATAKSKAMKESNERAAMLEKNIKDMQHLLELKAQAAASAKPAEPPKAQAKTEPAKVEAKTATAASVEPANPATPVAASGVAVAMPAQPAKPKIVPAVIAPPPSMLDDILSQPLYLAGGAAVLLGLGGVGYMRARRGRGGKPAKMALADNDDPTTDTGSRISAPVASSPDTGDFTQALVNTPAAAVDDAAVDPITEAELFLNFGRDTQAEEILVDALERDPANQQVILKLLSIYANRKDTKSFSSIARQVQESGDADAWAQAIEMGHKLEPNNPMYGAVADMADTVAVAAAVVEEAKPTEAAGLDFDLGVSAGQTTAASNGVLDITQNTEAVDVLDFDLGFEAPAEAGASAPMLMDFDITAPSQSAAQPSGSKPDEDAGMAFTLDIPAPVVGMPGMGMSGMDEIKLDMLDAADAAAPDSGAKDAHWHDVATKLDLARAYHEMGDAAGAKEILNEVSREGDAKQREAAAAMLQQMTV